MEVGEDIFLVLSTGVVCGLINMYYHIKDFLFHSKATYSSQNRGTHALKSVLEPCWQSELLH